MRGADTQQSSMFSYLSPEERIPSSHPLRPIRTMVDAVLAKLSSRFERMYSAFGRPSIAPEKLLRALLLQIFYSVRSERLLMEQLNYNLLFRWFVGLNADEAVWDATVYTKNRERLLQGNVAEEFFVQVLEQARGAALLSDEHFSVDGTLIEAWASQKSFRLKDQGPSAPTDDPGNPTVDFHGEKRSNETHESTTDADARLARKSGGHEAKLAYCGNVMIENRNGLVVDTELLQCNGTAERDAALLMAEREKPDIIVLDLMLGDENGLDFLPQLCKTSPSSRVLVLTGVQAADSHRIAIRRGAMGIVLKQQAAELLLKAIQKVHAGEVWIDRSMMGSVRMRLPVAAKIALQSAGAAAGRPGSPKPVGGATDLMK